MNTSLTANNQKSISLNSDSKNLEREKLLEKLILKQDLNSLSPTERIEYVRLYCESIGLNMLSKPVSLIEFQGKTILYVNKTGFDQLSMLHGISTEILDRGFIEESIYQVTVRATDKTGRSCTDMGVVDLSALDSKGKLKKTKPDAIMTAITKAKRRAIGGLIGVPSLEQAQQANSLASEQAEVYANVLPVNPRQGKDAGIVIEPIVDARPTSPFDEYRFIVEQNYRDKGWNQKSFNNLLMTKLKKSKFDSSFSIDEITKLNDLITTEDPATWLPKGTPEKAVGAEVVEALPADF